MTLAATAPMARHAARSSQLLQGVTSWLTEAERHPSTKKLFRIVFYGWLFFHTAVLVPFHLEIWAPGAFVLRDAFDPGSWFHWFGRLALHPALENLYALFVFGQLAALALAIFGTAPRFMSVLVAFFTLNVNSLATPLLDGGNNLSELLMLYLILVDTSGRHRVAAGSWSRISIAVSNAGLVLMRLQVVVVYLTAGMLKLNGELWQRGMALYYILQADAFSHPWMNKIVTSWPWIGMLGTYATLLFQWMFPSMVWFRRTRPWILAMGVGLHLGIAFGMGLLTFGLIMCLVYVLFLEERTTSRVLAWCSSRPVLEVHLAARSRRLPAVVRALARLAPAGSVRIEESAAEPSGALLQVREQTPTDEAESAPNGAQPAETVPQDDVLGLLRLVCRCKWLWPLAPALVGIALLWYVGLAQRVFARLFTAAAADESEAGAEGIA